MDEKRIIALYWAGLTLKQIINKACHAEESKIVKERATRQEIKLHVETVLLRENNRVARGGLW